MTLYWRSLNELEKTPEFEQFLHREFPVAASEYPTDISRRRWIQLMGASVALASVSGCRWEDQNVTTFVNRPDGRIPGVSEKYASFSEKAGHAVGTLVISYDGRPIKVDANREHPQGYSGTDSFIQSSVLDLYDPDRIARDVVKNESLRDYDPKSNSVLRGRSGGKSVAKTWGDFEAFLETWRKDAGDGASSVVLAESSSSLTLARLKKELLEKYPKLRWVEYEPFSRSNELRGLQQTFAEPVRLQYDIAKADVVVCFDSDLLGTHPGGLKHVADWASRRDPAVGKMNRVYAVESQYSTTGTVADHRLALQSSRIPSLIGVLVEDVKSRLAGKPASSVPEDADRATKMLAAVVDDLVASKGKAVVSVGEQHASEVHELVAHLNQLIGAYDSVVTLVKEPLAVESGVGQVQGLVKQMLDGKVESLFVLGGNPVYNTPSDVDFASALKQVKNSVHLSLYDDETSLGSSWHLPQAHHLESWGDGYSYNGTVTVRQPLILPFHHGRTSDEFVAMLLGHDHVDGYSLVRKTIAGVVGAGAEISGRAFRKIVHDGFTVKGALKSVKPTLVGKMPVLPKAKALSGSLEMVFTPSESVYDGRFANNAWLQETPDFMTKLTWDNVAIFSVATAEKLKVAHGTLVKLKFQGKQLEVPAYILPGQANDSVGLALGFGRTAAGQVGGSQIDGTPAPGVDAYQLQTAVSPVFGRGLEVVPTGKKFDLAVTQDHFSIDQSGMEEISHRSSELVREATLHEYQENSDFVETRVHSLDPEVTPWKLFEHPEKFDTGYQWGMSMDLAKCVGCNACMLACQSENNVPVVGKEQVLAGREMHWLRIDRYFAGHVAADDAHGTQIHPDETAIAVQPVTCQHCETAPCEQVCPVAATVHSEEGLNDMAYNRCIGTRYCGNNCPYKVRRFNYFYFNEVLDGPGKELVQLTVNPEVTVRTRGVMEKCSFCVQRIQSAKIEVMNKDRMDELAQMPDGAIITACQEACPTNAIEFGDIRNPDSKVAKAHADSRAYGLLDAELDTRPRNKYLGRVRNPHPSLEGDYYLQPHHHEGHGHKEGGHEKEKPHDHDKNHGHKDHEHKDHGHKKEAHKEHK